MAVSAGIIEAILRLRDELTPRLKLAGQQMKMSGQQMQTLGRNLLPLSLAFSAVGLAAAKFATDLNKNMANVASLIPNQTERVVELRGQMQELAEETGKSTGDITEGLYQVVSAYGDTADTAKLVEINARAAAAGLASTQDAIALTSAVTKGYGETSAEATQKAADLAFMTVKLGQTTFPQLAGSIGRVTAISAALGVSQEEMFAGFATLTGVIGDAAETSTGLRASMVQLLKPTDAMKTAFDKLGITNIQNTIAADGLVKTFRALVETTDGSATAVGELFNNVRALPTVLALVNGQATTFDRKLKELNNSVGSMDEAFREQTQGVNAAGFAWAQAKVKLENAAIAIGQQLMPTIGALVKDFLIPMLEKLQEGVRIFGTLPEPVKMVAIALGAIVAIAAPAVYAIGTITFAVGTLITALGTTSLGLLGALGALGLALAVGWGAYEFTTWIMDMIPITDEWANGLKDAVLQLTGMGVILDAYNAKQEQGTIWENNRTAAELAAHEAWVAGTDVRRARLEVDAELLKQGQAAAQQAADVSTKARIQAGPLPGLGGVADPTEGMFNLGESLNIGGIFSEQVQGLKDLRAEEVALAAAQAERFAISNEGIRLAILQREGQEALEAVFELTGQRITDVARAEEILKFAAANTTEALAAQAVKLADEQAKLEEAARRTAVEFKNWEVNLRLASQAAADANIGEAMAGAMQEAKESVEDLMAPLGLLAPTTFEISKEFEDLRTAVGMIPGALDGLNDGQLIQLATDMMRLKDSNALTNEELEYLQTVMNQLDAKGLEAIRKKLEDGERVAFDFAGALEIARSTAELLGNVGLGGLLGDMSVGVLSGLALADSIRDAKDAAGGFSKMDFSDQVGAIAAMGQQAASIWEQNKKQMSGGKGAMSGAASGAAAGSAFGPWGAAIGAVGGALLGFFAGKKFRKIAEDAGKVLGDGLSQETVEAIEETMAAMDLSAADASLLHIGDAIADTGKQASEFAGQMLSLMDAVESGAIPAADGIEAIGENFSLLAEEAEAAGRFASQAMTDMIVKARELGQEIPEIQAYVEGQLAGAVEGLGKFVDALAFVSDEALPTLGEQAGVIFGAVFDAIVADQGIVAAVDQLGGAFDVLHEKLMETLGPEATAAILGPYGAAFATLADENLRPLFEGIAGLTEVMVGLTNAGFLNQTQFEAIQNASATLFDEAIAGGADLGVTLQAMAPDIQAAIDAANRFGVPLTEDMQRLKDLAEANGFAFTTDPMEAMLDVLVAIAEVLGAEIPAAARRAGDAISAIPSAPPIPGAPRPGAGGGSGAGPGGEQGPGPQTPIPPHAQPDRTAQQGFESDAMPFGNRPGGMTTIGVHPDERVSVTPAGESAAGNDDDSGGGQMIQVIFELGGEQFYSQITKATKDGRIRVHPEGIKSF